MSRRAAVFLAVAFLAAAPAAAQEAGSVARAAADSVAQTAGATRMAPAGVTIERLDLTATPDIEARITVVDRAGDWVAGLRADEFDVRLDGEAVDLGAGGARLSSRFVDGEHLTVMIVVDVSGSMRASLGHVRAAIADFAARLGEDDEIGLVTVADAARVPIPPGADRARLALLLDSLAIGGNTAILDAVVASLDSLAARPAPRRALIVMSDGVDNRSRASAEEAATAARGHGIPVYAIALGEGADTTAMAALAGVSGGRLLREADPAELQRLYADLAGLLQSEYRLSIRLADDQVGGWHELSVTLRSALSRVPPERAADERPFLATRTPGVARGMVGSARAARDRTMVLRWWALGSLAALVPLLAIALLAARGRRSIRPLPLVLLILLAVTAGGLAALLRYWRGSP